MEYMSARHDRLANMVRSLLTDGERNAVRDDDGMDDNTKSSHLSRVKRKIRGMQADAEDLRTHRPELYDQLHEAVCEKTIDGRIVNLEAEVQALRGRVDELESIHESASSTNNNNAEDTTRK